MAEPVQLETDGAVGVIRLDRPPVNAINDAMHAEIRAAVDFRVVGESALVGLPEITLGVLPGAGGTQRLPRRIGVTKAEEMIFSGS